MESRRQGRMSKSKGGGEEQSWDESRQNGWGKVGRGEDGGGKNPMTQG